MKIRVRRGFGVTVTVFIGWGVGVSGEVGDGVVVCKVFRAMVMLRAIEKCSLISVVAMFWLMIRPAFSYSQHSTVSRCSIEASAIGSGLLSPFLNLKTTSCGFVRLIKRQLRSSLRLWDSTLTSDAYWSCLALTFRFFQRIASFMVFRAFPVLYCFRTASSIGSC